MFKTILENTTSEIIEKKSKFIANVFCVENEEQANIKIKEIKRKHFDARHNCFAFRVMEDEKIIERFSDDGEPSGTAGAPMLNILQKNNLCNILVVVTRYFGGILLGTGGLVRAYSEACIQAIQNSNKVDIFWGVEYEVKLEYGDLENFRYYCNKNNINMSNIQYSSEVIWNIEMKEDFKETFLKDINNRNINVVESKFIKNKYITIALP